jgi:hypothetical protein
MHVRVSILLTIGERESSGGPNVVLCSPVFNALLEASGRVQPLLPFNCNWPGRRQSLDLCGPLDRKPIATNFEDDPIADYIVS